MADRRSASPPLSIVRTTRKAPISDRAVSRVVACIFRGERRRLRLSIAIVGDREMRRINRRHLGHDYATDALAFPLDGEGVEGEVIVSAETARREGRARGHGARAELLLYVAHGILHLLGYDDHSEPDRREMRERAERYLRCAGFRTQG